MGFEIERRFLVPGEFPEGDVSSIAQAYLSVDPKRTLRVRIAGDEAWLAVKGKPPGLKWRAEEGTLSATTDFEAEGIERLEFEYPVPLADAREMFEMGMGSPIYKSRVSTPAGGGLTWEIDVFYGANCGLVIAEIELESVEQEFAQPGWLGREVTSEPLFTNAHLAERPFGQWDEEEREGMPCSRLEAGELRELSPFQLRLRPVEELDLSVRALNLTANADIFSIGQLLATTEAHLLSYGSTARTSVTEIQERLAQIDPSLQLGVG